MARSKQGRVYWANSGGMGIARGIVGRSSGAVHMAPDRIFPGR